MGNSIFICYSHEDIAWLQEIEAVLKQANLHLGIRHWSDKNIGLGQKWRNEIESALNESVASIMLISGSFLRSSFIKEIELPSLLQNKLVFPLLISNCLWREISWLEQYQIFPNNPVMPLDKLEKDIQKDLLIQFISDIIHKLGALGENPGEPLPSKDEKRFIRSQNRKTKNTKKNQHDLDNAIILSVDIRDFSLMTPEEQGNAISLLWHVIDKNKNNELYHHISPNEDGAVIVLPAYNHAYQYAIDQAKKWIVELATLPASVQVRISIHEGAVSKIKLPRLQDDIYFGTAINESRKLCSYAGNGHIAISDIFLERWDLAGNANYNELRPGKGREPIDVMVKEDKHIGIRILAPTDSLPSSRLALLNVVDEQIMQILSDIEEAFVGFLRSLGMKNVQNKTSPRVSILTPIKRHGNRFLASSAFRYHATASHIRKGTTFYDIEPPGAGPCGRAFVSGKIQVAAGLPDPVKNTKAYFKTWETKWHMPQENVKGFSRPSQAIISIPFGLDEWPYRLGIICIDCLHPLLEDKTITVQSIHSFCVELYDEFNMELSLLWLHRIHI